MDALGPGRRFNRWCYAIALVWMLAVVAPSAILKERVPDFVQYYLGGAVVLAQEPSALYPVPRPGADHNAGFVDGSEVRPAYAALAREHGIDPYPRFVYPPPTALLFVPFALPPYPHSLALWLVLMSLAGWGVALTAARIHARIAGGPSRWSGWIALAVAGSPLMLHAIRSGNVSPAIALFVGLALLGLIDERGRGTGLWLALGGVFKATSAALLPLVVARRRWSSLAAVSALAAGSIVGSLALLGMEPMREFVVEIAPTHGQSDTGATSQSVTALLLRLSGRTALPAAWSSTVSAVHFVVFLALSGLVWARRATLAGSPLHVAAAGAGLLSCVLAFSPLVWAHHHLLGFLTLGWLVEEARRSRAWALAALLPITALLSPLCLLARADLPVPEPLVSHMGLGALVVLALAAARLWSAKSARVEGRVRP